MSLLIKDPASVLDFSIDWGAKYLGADGLVDSEWTVEPLEAGGPTVEIHDHDERIATVKVSGGTSGRIYTLRNSIATQGGQVDTRSFTLRVEAL